MKKSLLLKIVSVILVVVGFVGSVNAQVTTSSMTGAIRDSKESLPGAGIKATHTPTGTVYTTTTNNDGRYNIPNARVGGPYRVEISFVGYQTKVVEDIYLKLGDATVLNIQLDDNVNTLKDVVITGSAGGSKSKIGAATSISRQQIAELPAISRSITDLTK